MTGMMPEGDESEPVRPRMTMRVYRVSPDGRVTEVRGPVGFMVDEKTVPVMTSQFPPCRCPRHRDGGTGRKSARG